MRFISVSGMLFNVTVLAAVYVFVLGSVPAGGAVIDRVAASVDDTAITMTELDGKYKEIGKINENITYGETLRSMINSLLIVKDAKRYRMEGKDDDELIKQYIDLKIRALITVQDNDVKGYYEEHRGEFRGRTYEEVHDDIVRYLTEVKVNNKLKRHIDVLRKKSLILINIDIPE